MRTLSQVIRSRPSIGASLRLAVFFCLSGLGAGETPTNEARDLIPWKKLDDKTRVKLEEVVDHANVYHRTPTEVFACSPELYLLMLHDPVLTLQLWKTVGASDATLEAIGPWQYEGRDGHASNGRWEFVYRSPDMNVIYAQGQYHGPLLGGTLETKSVLVLRTAYFQERDGKQYVKHQLDGYVKAESGSIKPIAKALRPLFQKNVEATMQESLWFVSLMCRYVMYDPHTIAHSLDQIERVDGVAKARMQKLLAPLLATTPERKEIAQREPSTSRE